VAGAVAPGSDVLEAFSQLLSANIRRAERIARLIRADLEYRERHSGQLRGPGGTDEGVLKDADGRPQMTLEYALQQLLAVRADIRRMVAGLTTLRITEPDMHAAHLENLREAVLPIINGFVPLQALDGRFDFERAAINNPMQHALGAFERLAAESVQQAVDHGETLSEVAMSAIFAADEAQLVLSEIHLMPNGQTLLTRAVEAEWRLDSSWREVASFASEAIELVTDDLQSLLATKLFSPRVRCLSAAGDEEDAWRVYPWLAHSVLYGLTNDWLEPTARADLSRAVQFMDLPEEIREPVTRFLDDVLRQWTQTPARFETALKEGSLGWPAVGGIINLIPSPHSGSCQSVLVVICTGRTEFSKHVRLAQEHFYDCLSSTRTVIFVTSFWDGDYFARERQPTFERLSREYGIKFYVVLKTGRYVACSRLTSM
jgi:predicted component of type VI protein secretion system